MEEKTYLIMMMILLIIGIISVYGHTPETTYEKRLAQLQQQQNQTYQKYIQCVEHYTELQDDFTQLITQTYERK